MLGVNKGKSRRIDNVKRENDALYLFSEAGTHRLMPVDPQTVRVTYTCNVLNPDNVGSEAAGGNDNENSVSVNYSSDACELFSKREKPGVILKSSFSDWSYEENDGEIRLKTGKLQILINKESSAYTYYDIDGNVLLKDNKKQPRSLEEFTSYKLVPEAEVKKEYVQTADGKKEILRDVPRIPDEILYHTRMNFIWDESEALYGLGQHEQGLLNLRGQMVYIHQANRQIAVPVLVSSKGYGLLIDNYSPMIFGDTPYGSYIYCEAADDIDFYFINGYGMAGVVREYRRLTGKASMLPYWSFGYVQSQERYETAQEIIDTVKEFKKRNIGISCIVLDWLSWPDNQWGQKTFDKNRFPDPQEMIDELHKMDVHFMISIWPTMSEGCPNNAEFAEKGLFLPASNVYNAFDKKGRELYWKQANEGLFRYGVDAWWCDSSEPYTLEWMHRERQEPAVLYDDYCRSVANNIPTWETNAFALYHAMALYEGQRGETADKPLSADTAGKTVNSDIPEKTAGSMNSDITGTSVNENCASESVAQKRVINLTRSSYTGQQRYGTVLWSGDTDASWDTLKKQIRAGLSFCASGLPYWTTDIGAFFVRRGDTWFWQGDYPEANEDPAYCELYVRWTQWECFLPMFRAHGTDCRREPWHFEQAGREFYDAIVKAIDFRYRLMPYIYSTAGKVWLEDASFIRMLAFDHPDDATARECGDQYMFGDSIMVCPVTSPMYYDVDGKIITDVPGSRKVYLPAGGWFDYFSGDYYEGGQWITAEAPLERIPLFVRDGSIIPVAVSDDKLDSSNELSNDPIGAVNSADASISRSQKPAALGRKNEIGLEIFAKNNANYVFYDDAKDGYGYENGEYREISFTWNATEKKLDTKVLYNGLNGNMPEFRVIAVH